MSDLTYAEAEAEAFQRKAEELGADFSIDLNARNAVSEELWFLRNHMASGEVQEILPDGALHLMVGWGCDHEAAILLGRLRETGWRLVRG